MKKYLVIGVSAIIVIIILVILFTPNIPMGNSGKIKAVASFYPVFNFAQQVGGDRVEVLLLIPAGIDPHNYEPKPSDIKVLSEARLFILNGILEDPWVPTLLAGIDNPTLIVVNTSKDVLLISSQDPDIPGNDPHIWLDPVYAEKQVVAIRDAFIQADPSGKDYYESQAGSYIRQLSSLDTEFRTSMATCKNKDFIITHATMTYFCKEYGCRQIPVIGVNAEGEPTPQTVAAIIQQAKAKNISVVFVENLYNPRIAQTIAQEIGGKVAVINTLHGLTPEQQQRGENYITIMEENLMTLKANLECI